MKGLYKGNTQAGKRIKRWSSNLFSPFIYASGGYKKLKQVNITAMSSDYHSLVVRLFFLVVFEHSLVVSLLC